MRKILLLAMLFVVLPVSSASADWRWASPKFKIKRVKPACETYQCHKVARIRARANYRARVAHYHARKRAEWKMWTSLYIPKCTWYGESGTGPEYSRARYTMPQTNGPAYGKFQFEARTYRSSGKYDDWSPLDQEIAARQEYWKHGIFPWTNCTR